MDASELRRLAQAVADGAATPDELVDRVRADAARSVADLGYAQVDTQRGLRTGVSEVVYGAGKTADQIAGILAAMQAAGQARVLVTRLAPDKAAAVARLLDVALEDAEASSGPSEGCADVLDSEVPLRYWPTAQLAVRGDLPAPDGNGTVVVAAAGL